MKIAALLFILLGPIGQGNPTTSQVSRGDCSPNISNVNGNVTVQVSGSACSENDPKVAASITTFLRQYPNDQQRIIELLNRKDADSQALLTEAAALVRNLSEAYRTRNDQSRIALLDTRWDFTKKLAPWPIFTFYYHNLGKLPAHGITRTTNITVTGGELTDDAIARLQDEADLHEDYFEASKKTEFTEIYPDDRMNHFWSMPSEAGPNADALNSQLDELQNGTEWLYIFINMKWKDGSMAEHVVGVTEVCKYFAGNFFAPHECGRNRSYQREFPVRSNQSSTEITKQEPAILRQFEKWTVRRDDAKRTLTIRGTFTNSSQLQTTASVGFLARLAGQELPEANPASVTFASGESRAFSTVLVIVGDDGKLPHGDLPLEVDVFFDYVTGQGDQCRFLQNLTLADGATHVDVKHNEEANQSCHQVLPPKGISDPTNAR